MVRIDGFVFPFPEQPFFRFVAQLGNDDPSTQTGRPLVADPEALRLASEPNGEVQLVNFTDATLLLRKIHQEWHKGLLAWPFASCLPERQQGFER